MEKIELKMHKPTKPLRMTSIEETIQLARLQQAATTSSLYERKHNQKALKVLTVAAYILFVSMAAIILSFYYVFIWDPTSKPIQPRPTTNCETNKIVIPENIAIRLVNSTEISAENFFKTLYQRYQDLQKSESQMDEEQVEAMKRSSSSSLMLRRLVNPVSDAPPPPFVTGPSVYNQFAAGAQDQTENDINYSKSNINSTPRHPIDTTQTPIVKPQLQSLSQQQVAYVDDEDMENDYSETEASGANKPTWNDTTILLSSYSDTDDND